ncbi:MAG: choice-of-anchor L domain-containing protein [Dehalococcoidia bacterium]
MTAGWALFRWRRIALVAAVVAAAGFVVLRTTPGFSGTQGLTVTTMSTEQVSPQDLVESLLGYPPPQISGVAGQGQIDYFNITYTGSYSAAGLFAGGNGILGFDEGIVLSTGDPNYVVGPNVLDETSWANDQSGDPDLDAIVAPNVTGDATVLEFDFVPPGETIQFRYVFSSEEYNEFVHQSFNDVFGFFINGTNCAKVGNEPVSIDTINNGNPFGTQPAEHPELYVNNDLDDGGGQINTEMDGLTVVLTCTAGVVPNQTNHIKLAIADTTDFAYDSNVFLEGASFAVAPTATPTPPPAATPVPTDTPTAAATQTAAPPTGTATSAPATNTASPVPPTNTPTPVPATVTSTPVPPTRTPTSLLPTPTRTRTPTSTLPPTSTRIPPTATLTFTPVPPTSTLPPAIVSGAGLVVPPPATATAPPEPTARPSPTPTRQSEVLGGAVTPASPPDGGEVARPAGGGLSGESRTTRAILSPDQISTDTRVIATNLLLAFILLITLLVSSTLFNSTIDENRTSFNNFMNRLLAPFKRMAVDVSDAWGGGLGAAPVTRYLIAPAIVIGITGLIYMFSDASAGWNEHSAVLFVSLIIALAIATYVYEGGEALVTRQRFRFDAGVRVFPAAIAIAIGFVTLARLTHFEAPVIFGFVASCVMLAPAELERHEAGQVVSAPAVILLALALGAWALLIPLRDATGDAGAWGQVPTEVAALIFIGGIEGLVFAMVPLRFNDGWKIASFNRLVWLVLMAVPLFIFCWVVVNPQAKEFDALLEGRVRTVVGLVVAYAAVTAAVWLFFHFRNQEAGPPGGSRRQQLQPETASTASVASIPLQAEQPVAPSYPDLLTRRDDP